MISAGRGAANRTIVLAAALAGMALASCCATGAAGASDAGGTASGGAPAGAPATAPSGGSSPSAKTGTTPRVEGTGAHVTSVRITSLACTPSSSCTTNPRQVSQRGRVLVKGIGLKAGMVLGFPRVPGARVTRSSPSARLVSTSGGLLATVPGNAHSGKVMVLLSHGRYTSSYGPVYVYDHALRPPAPKAAPDPASGSAGALEGQGMWIWYVSASEKGSLPAIVARAHAAGVTTLFVKSSDGSSNYWSQFSPELVSTLHAAGLKVCAWQYVYGTDPAGEAALGAEAVANGADCLVIDAEEQYEGRYAAAQTYIADLRAKIGPSYPVALASFPYVDYHESFPYSVFLGPEGAQFNAPQMYWKAIGQSVDTVYANTYIGNRIYGRPIFPLGQTYESPGAAELLRFREEAVDYGATGWSFWDWQETSSGGWTGLTDPMAPLTTVTPNSEWPELAQGRKGDQVLWLQEHLAAAIPTQETTGVFGSATRTNLEAFQTAHGLPASGVATPATWTDLLALAPVAVTWTGSGPAGG